MNDVRLRRKGAKMGLTREPFLPVFFVDFKENIVEWMRPKRNHLRVDR